MKHLNICCRIILNFILRNYNTLNFICVCMGVESGIKFWRQRWTTQRFASFLILRVAARIMKFCTVDHRGHIRGNYGNVLGFGSHKLKRKNVQAGHRRDKESKDGPPTELIATNNLGKMCSLLGGTWVVTLSCAVRHWRTAQLVSDRTSCIYYKVCL